MPSLNLGWLGLALPVSRLEQELELAREQGRWLSDEELVALEQQQADQRKLQRRLLVMLALSVLVPLFWPLVPVFAGLLLFPRTTRRVLLLALVAALLLMVLLVWLLVALIAAL